LRGDENLCERPQFTGWDVDGGFAEYMVAPAGFVYRLPSGMTDLATAPLLCAGIIGYRCLRLTGVVGDDTGLPGRKAIGDRSSDRSQGLVDAPRLGIYGFGSAASLCTQVAVWRGWNVYAFTRGALHRDLAREVGAAWTGEVDDDPGVGLDAAIVFAPVGELAIAALCRLDKGGIVALGGIYSTPIPPIEYPWVYHERVLRSVANSTRRDARELLRDAAVIPVRSRVQEYALEDANQALLDLKEDRVRGSAVLRVA
jgi:propanol-preferring alcohol dehydrogenase